MSGQPFLQLKDISKNFGVTQALKGVSFSIQEGEVVALIGENGAGKSTLMKVLGGVHQPTSGQIELNGKSCEILNAKDAERKGIGFVHQELNLLDNLDIASNIFLGREDRRWGWIQKGKLNEKSKPLLESLGLNLDPSTPLSELSNAQQQLVEIAKALSMQARLLILDEPTSSLSAYETEQLLDLILELKAKGMAVIYISHRLSEIEKIADRVVGLRDGEMVGELNGEEIQRDAMVSLMIGRDLSEVYPKLNQPSQEVLLQVKDLASQLWPEGRADFDIKCGEIVGIYGLVGAGRSEMAQALFGVDDSPSGEILLEGQPLKRGNIKACIKAGVYLAPEDRKKSSLLLEMSIRENMSLNSLASFSSCFKVNQRKEKDVCDSWLKDYGVKAESIEAAPNSLSGGNQQKVVLSKWMTQNPKIMIFDEPTRGIDIGARHEIYENITKLASTGCGVLMISSDMEELLGMSHRIVVMKDGNTMGDLPRETFSEAALMQLMMNETKDEVEA